MQELLRTRKPFYFVKYQEAISRGGLRLRQEAELRRQQENTKREADELLAQIEDALEKKQLRILVDVSEKLRLFCVTTHIRILPERNFYLTKIYNYICDAYYDLYRINKAQQPWDQEKRIYTLLGLELESEPSVDSIIEQFKGVYVDYK